MKNEKVEKYIVSGSKKHRFTALDFLVRKKKDYQIKAHGKDEYQVKCGKITLNGSLSGKKQNRYTVELNGNKYSFSIDREETFKRKSALKRTLGEDNSFELKAPMPGKICEIFVSEGVKVRKGEPLLILEAMKMQNQVLASHDAEVVQILVKKDEIVLGDQILLEMKNG